MELLNYILAIELKSLEHYEFLRNHFDFPIEIDFEKFMKEEKNYVVSVRMNEPNNIHNPLMAVSIFKLHQDKININYVAVCKDFRKKGINRAINKFIEDIARSNYIDFLTANIREKNINSINSFLGCGFLINENRKFKYKNGDGKIHIYKKITI